MSTNNHVPHDKQKIQGEEAKALSKPLKETCEWLLSKPGQKHLTKVANQIRKEVSVNK